MTPKVNQILVLDFKFVRTVTIIPAMIMSMGITNVKDANKMLCHVVAEKQKIKPKIVIRKQKKEVNEYCLYSSKDR
jgi:hypothetical protein